MSVTPPQLNQPTKKFSSLFHNLGIRQKICLGYAVAISIAIIGAMTGRLFELSYKENLKKQLLFDQQTSGLLSRLNNEVLNVIILQKVLPQTINNPKVFQKNMGEKLSHFFDVNNLLQELSSNVSNYSDNQNHTEPQELQEFTETYAQSVNNYANILEDVVQQLEKAGANLNLTILTQQYNKLNQAKKNLSLSALAEESNKISLLFQGKSEEALRNYQSAEKLGTLILIISLLISALIAAIIAILTSRAIALPLEATTKIAQQVTEEQNFDLQAPVTTEDEIGLLTIALNHLIKKVGEYTDELQAAKHKAEAANRSKSAFLATMSHELRTPLNAIIGYSEILQDEAADLGYGDFLPDLERIQTAGKHLLEMISDILDISKIEAGQVTLYLESIDIGGLIQDVMTTAKPLIEKNNNVLKMVTGDKLGTMYADQPKVRQILLNLLSNASKFTENGVITLEADRIDNPDFVENGSQKNVSPMQTNRHLILFKVIDTGIGMTQEQMEIIFQPFTQADASTTRKYGGTGLGLAICQRLCERMGGEIIVSSNVDKGSVFEVKFPERVIPID
ncbi:MAG: sensor histidine kinase [Microcoleaceae cyanobacterium]